MSKRYQLTENGVSPRWVPGAYGTDGDFLPVFFANGDEHDELGSVDESAKNAIEMVEKRRRKQSTILANLPEPRIFGPEKADFSFVGFGSSLNVILDLMNYLDQDNGGNGQDENGALEKKNQTNLHQKLKFGNLWENLENQQGKSKKITVNYLHFSYLWPLRTEVFRQFVVQNHNVCLIEGNAVGQFGKLITSETGYIFERQFLKYDGRQFFIEDLLEFINNSKPLESKTA